MKIEQFVSGKYLQQQNYKSFSPAKINSSWTWEDVKINTLLAEANRKVGGLDAFSLHVPDTDIFIEMHVIKEATKSSKIEGTQTHIEEAIKKESEIDPERRNDWQEVRNYIDAMNTSINKLNTLPVSTRLLKEAHKILMRGVRGEHRHPGEFRTSQNWIGGATINDAVYVPPVHTEVNELMGDLENFLHNEQVDVPVLVRAAIAHYQFETIHPFLDGNGRIGRLLITLFLVSSGVLAKPTLYLSDYFEKHRSLYYDNLNNVRAANNLTQWIKFFIVAVIETSKRGIQTFNHILKLKEEVENEKIISLGKKLPKAKKLMNYLYANPLVSSGDITKKLNVTPATANALIEDFVKLGILTEITGGKRYRTYSFHKYLNLFTDKKS